MLSIKNLDAFYGKLHVLWDVSLELGNECVGIFGPNGAGKTTLINCIVGLVKPQGGTIDFDNKPLLNQETFHIIRSGIAIVPQERELFPLMTAAENLEAGSCLYPGRPCQKERAAGVYLQHLPGA